MYYMLCIMCYGFFSSENSHLENAKEALEQIGSYHIVFRGSIKVKVNRRYCNFYLLKRRSETPSVAFL